MTYYCTICWNKVEPDGCAFYCPIDNHLLNKEQINWIDGYFVFDTEKNDFVKHYDEPAYPKVNI